MNNPEATYELISSYVLGTLDDVTRASFEQQIASDADLQGQVAFEQMAHNAVFQAKLVAASNEIKSEFKQVRTQGRNKRNLFFGASGTVLIAILALVFWRPETPSTMENANTEPKTEKATETAILSEDPSQEQNTTITKVPEVQKTPSYTSPEKEGNPFSPSETHNTTPPSDSVLVDQTPQEESEPLILAAKPAEEKAEHKVVHECPTIPLTVRAETPCIGNPTEMTLEIVAGTAPFTTLVDGEEYDGLEGHEFYAGTYEVMVKDKDGCTSEMVMLTIKEKRCYSPPSSFNPTNGAPWTYESGGKELELKILNTTGKEIYSASGIDPSWDGTDNNGNLQPMDVYIYLIYQDQEFINKGQVTLTR